MSKIIQKLINTNDKIYQLTKAAEETSELTTALLQYITKKGRKTTKQDVIDEIGDAKIRIEILEEIFGKKAVKKRYTDKLKKFTDYLETGKYKGRI